MEKSVKVSGECYRFLEKFAQLLGVSVTDAAESCIGITCNMFGAPVDVTLKDGAGKVVFSTLDRYADLDVQESAETSALP